MFAARTTAAAKIDAAIANWPTWVSMWISSVAMAM
jgi:hypothetical protein